MTPKKKKRLWDRQLIWTNGCEWNTFFEIAKINANFSKLMFPSCVGESQQRSPTGKSQSLLLRAMSLCFTNPRWNSTISKLNCHIFKEIHKIRPWVTIKSIIFCLMNNRTVFPASDSFCSQPSLP
jgi:hypothetical protein